METLKEGVLEDRSLPLVLLAIEEVIEEKEWSAWRTL